MAGIPVQFVSKALGHGSIGLTEDHYAKYLGQGGEGFRYVEPLQLASGEVTADLLGRSPESPHQSP